jgi:hypothetical protein
MSKSRDSVEDLRTIDTVTATANAALPKSGGALTGAVTTNSTFDGVDIATRDGVLTSTTATAAAALPKAGGTMTGDTAHGDNVKAKFGASDDLEIYHSGTNSYLWDKGTGNLFILGTSVTIGDAAGYDFINCVDEGSGGYVRLNHTGNAEKFRTTSTGVSISGSTAHTAGDITNSIAGTYKLFGANGTAGSGSYVTYAFEGDNDTGMYHPAADKVGFVTGGTERVRIGSDYAMSVTGDTLQNGVRTFTARFNVSGNTAIGFDVAVPNEGGGGNSFMIHCGFNHFHNTAYGCHRISMMSARGTSLSTVGTVLNQTSGNAGQWSFSKPTGTILRITKTAGNYAGGGGGFVHVMFSSTV